MENYTLLWLIAMIIFIVIEMLTVGLTSLWFAVGALFALIASLLDTTLSIQLIVFAVISIAALLTTRPLLVKKMKLGKIKTNVDQLIGAEGIVLEGIGTYNTGLVKVSGQIWSAKSMNGEEIPKDQTIIVEGVEGVKLIVTKI